MRRRCGVPCDTRLRTGVETVLAQKENVSLNGRADLVYAVGMGCRRRRSEAATMSWYWLMRVLRCTYLMSAVHSATAASDSACSNHAEKPW